MSPMTAIHQHDMSLRESLESDPAISILEIANLLDRTQRVG
jgi:hypothetical protein